MSSEQEMSTGQNVGERETTLVSPPTTQPTNKPDEDYLSFRLTVDEKKFDDICQNVFHNVPYIAYHHLGKDKSNPHYHLLLLVNYSSELTPDYSKLIEKYRQRIKRCGLSGNKDVSIKLNRNGVLQGIQYCSHEDTQPIVSDDSLLELVARAPKWIQKSITPITERPTKRPRGDPDWQLTYTNLVSVVVKHARDHSITDKSLRGAVSHLIQNTKWRPSKWLVSGGVPEFYENDYLMRLGKRKEPDMNWWTPRNI